MSLLIVGKILGTHNLKGEVKVYSNIENLEKLIGQKIIVELEDGSSKLLSIKKIEHLLGEKWIFHFEEIKNKNDAMQLRNCFIKIRRDILGISEDEIFMNDVIGIDVYDEKNNEYLGKVKEIFETAAHNIYVVESEKYETMIPDIDYFVKTLNLKEKKLIVNLIDGMKEEKK